MLLMTSSQTYLSKMQELMQDFPTRRQSSEELRLDLPRSNPLVKEFQHNNLQHQ